MKRGPGPAKKWDWSVSESTGSYLCALYGSLTAMVELLRGGKANDDLLANLGRAAVFVGLSWVASDILAAMSWYYLQGNISNAALWQSYIRLNEMRLFTAASAAALAVVGYRAAKGWRPRRIALLAVVGLFLAGVAVFSVLRPPGFLGSDSPSNSYLLQGSVLALGGIIFMMSSDKGFKAAGFLAGTLGVVLLYMGGLTFPMGFVDYVERTAASPYFVYFGWPQGPYWISSNTYYFLSGTTTALLGTVPFVLAAWVIKAYEAQRRVVAAKAMDMILRLCGVAFGTVLIAISCFAMVMIGSLLVFAVSSPRLIPGFLGVPIIASILVAGLPVCVLQASGGAFLILGCRPRWSSLVRLTK